MAGIKGNVIRTKTTHRRVLDRLMGWMEGLGVRAMNTYRAGGGKDEDDKLWTRRR